MEYFGVPLINKNFRELDDFAPAILNKTQFTDQTIFEPKSLISQNVKGQETIVFPIGRDERNGISEINFSTAPFGWGGGNFFNFHTHNRPSDYVYSGGTDLPKSMWL